MAIDTSKCEITSKGPPVRIRTAKGLLSYPKLFTPEDGKWSVSLLFPKSADLSAFNEAVDLAAKDKFGPDYAKKYPKLKKPFLNTADSPSIGADPEAFPTFIRTSTKAEGNNKTPPGVVNHKMDPVTAESGEVYAGRWAMLTLSVKGYDTDGNKGVTCYVNNVQLLEHGTPLGGGRVQASSEFEAVPISDSADALFQ